MHDQLLNVAMDNLPVAVCVVGGRDLRVLHTNAVFRSIAPEGVVTGARVDGAAATSGQRFAEICQQILDTGTPQRLVDVPAELFRSDRTQGQEAFFTWSFRRLKLPRDEGWAILCTAWETTERKQTVDRLRESEDRYRQLLEVSPVGVAVHAGGKLVFTNPAGARLLGADTPDDLIGKSIAEIIHPDHLSLAAARIGRMLAGEEGLYPVEDRYVRLDGKEIDVEVMAAPLTYDGKPAVQVIVQDITERKEAMESLKRSEERYRSTLDNMLEGAQIMGFDWRFLYVNDVAARYNRHTKEELLGRKNFDVFPGFEQTEGFRDMQYCMENRATLRREYAVPFPDGSVDWFDVQIQPVPEGIFILSQDISERKQAEEALRLSRDRLAELSLRLVEANENERRAIGRELHDEFGQILTAMKITLDLVGQLPPETAARKIVQAQELATELLTRVSRLSLELRPSMLDDLGLAPALVWQVNRYQEQTGIDVAFSHSGVEKRRFATAIETTVYRVIQEALTNVARHADATLVTLVVRVNAGWLEIEIDDDGVGFDVEDALAQRRGLTGMRERAQLVGGTVDIESAPGSGTHKLIRLPLPEGTL